MLLIGCFDGELFVYFEVFWLKEDVFGLYVVVCDYDCGLWMLVGELCWCGLYCVVGWLLFVVYYLFFDDLCIEVVGCVVLVGYMWVVDYFVWYGFVW